MAKIKIYNDNFSITSKFSVEDIKAISEFAPDVLTLTDSNGEIYFAISYDEDLSGVNKWGIMFTKNGMDGYASVSLPIPENETRETIKGYLVDKYFSILHNLELVEQAMVEVVDEIAQMKLDAKGKIAFLY